LIDKLFMLLKLHLHTVYSDEAWLILVESPQH